GGGELVVPAAPRGGHRPRAPPAGGGDGDRRPGRGGAAEDPKGVPGGRDRPLRGAIADRRPPTRGGGRKLFEDFHLGHTVALDDPAHHVHAAHDVRKDGVAAVQVRLR